MNIQYKRPSASLIVATFVGIIIGAGSLALAFHWATGDRRPAHKSEACTMKRTDFILHSAAPANASVATLYRTSAILCK